MPSKRDRENAALTCQIIEIHERSRGIYGYPRVHAELSPYPKTGKIDGSLVFPREKE
jgi:hypothetical protein